MHVECPRDQLASAESKSLRCLNISRLTYSAASEEGWGLLPLLKTNNNKKRTKMAGGGGGRVQNCFFGAVSSMKLATESAWSALFSRRFHSIVVFGKKVFVLGNVAEWVT